MARPPELPAVIRPLERRDVAAVASLARVIWLAHYSTIISREQIEYMLADRFTPQRLQTYLARDERWMDVMELDGALVGYCSYARTRTPGELKLEQLYLSLDFHARGLGQHMLAHVDNRARQLGCTSIVLQVNKHNEKAIRAYRRAGYSLREEVVIDIGSGFVMDDYIMTKQLEP